jgi:serine/threonine protein kinase
MAPEILKFNGEETYSEKVDCFSFGMLLYELITLKHPFDGQEQIKDIILNGGRPLIKSQDLLYPTLMLDLMCLCWLDNPADRPSAENIHRYTKSYEFSHLLDVTLLEDYEKPPLVITCLNQGKNLTKKTNHYFLIVDIYLFKNRARRHGGIRRANHL